MFKRFLILERRHLHIRARSWTPFSQDNVIRHVAQDTRNYIARDDIGLIDWPMKSRKSQDRVISTMQIPLVLNQYIDIKSASRLQPHVTFVGQTFSLDAWIIRVLRSMNFARLCDWFSLLCLGRKINYSCLVCRCNVSQLYFTCVCNFDGAKNWISLLCEHICNSSHSFHFYIRPLKRFKKKLPSANDMPNIGSLHKT